MAVEQCNYVSKADEIRYRMAQELLAWTLGSTFDARYSVSRETCDVEKGVLSIRHDTKAFGGRR